MGEAAAATVVRALPNGSQLWQPENAEGVLRGDAAGGGSRHWDSYLKYGGNDKLKVDAYR